MSVDFIRFQKGSIKQYEIVDSYDYEKIYYSTNPYLPRGENYSIKNILNLTVVFNLLNETVRAISFANEATSLRPVFMNIEYFNE